METVARLLAGAATLRIIVTSRAARFQAERVIEIEGLPYPAADEAAPAADYAAIGSSPAAPGNGMRPLRSHPQRWNRLRTSAVRWAACRWRSSWPRRPGRAADDRGHPRRNPRGIDILTATMRDVPPRHRSAMRAVFAASLAECSRRKSRPSSPVRRSFGGGFRTAAARAVVDATPQQLAPPGRPVAVAPPRWPLPAPSLLLQYATESSGAARRGRPLCPTPCRLFRRLAPNLSPAIYGDGQAAAGGRAAQAGQRAPGVEAGLQAGRVAFFAEVLGALLLSLRHDGAELRRPRTLRERPPCAGRVRPCHAGRTSHWHASRQWRGVFAFASAISDGA